MGQKVHPIGFRLGVVETWSSRWYAKKDYANFLHEDLAIRKYIKEKLLNIEFILKVKKSSSRLVWKNVRNF